MCWTHNWEAVKSVKELKTNNGENEFEFSSWEYEDSLKFSDKTREMWNTCSTTTPLRNTTILSALRTVESRCATTTTVLPAIRESRAACRPEALQLKYKQSRSGKLHVHDIHTWTTFSLSVSKAEVASSRRRILENIKFREFHRKNLF